MSALSPAAANLLFGQDARLRIRVKLSLLATLIYVSWAALFTVGMQQGVVIFEHLGQAVVAVALLAGAAFYSAVRSGLTARLQDPALVLPQIVVAYCLCACAYICAPDMRGSLLQAMCVIQVFGLISLTPREVALAGAASVASVTAAWVGCLLWAPPGTFAPGEDGLSLLTSAFILALLALLSYNYSGMRAKVREQKQVLGRAMQQVEHTISHDALTGLFNRRHMVQLITREASRAERSGMGMALVLIDLDHFKRINDAHGHLVGDEALQAFADVAQAAIRETDTIGRWGGEEFILLLPDTHPADRATLVTERIQKILQHTIVSQVRPELRLSFSGGVAVPRVAETLDAMLDRADQALYAAKAQGRKKTIIAP